VSSRRLLVLLCAAVLSASVAPADGLKKLLKKEPEKSALDLYIEDAHRRAVSAGVESPGSLWSSPATMSDLATDVRARAAGDMVTILVQEQASAVSTGQTKTSRSSSANAAINSIAGPLATTGRLANLANLNSSTSLDGEGTTLRQTTLTTTITARVTDVLPNGYLVVEGSKTLAVNSENQVITLRGVVRPADLTNANVVQSGNVAQMELKINGHGVVNDVIRRPNILYRILLGLLPF